jgi:hypothetical protein
MSNIRSASSNTTYVTRFRFVTLPAKKCNFNKKYLKMNVPRLLHLLQDIFSYKPICRRHIICDLIPCITNNTYFQAKSQNNGKVLTNTKTEMWWQYMAG